MVIIFIKLFHLLNKTKINVLRDQVETSGKENYTQLEFELRVIFEDLVSRFLCWFLILLLHLFNKINYHTENGC